MNRLSGQEFPTHCSFSLFYCFQWLLICILWLFIIYVPNNRKIDLFLFLVTISVGLMGKLLSKILLLSLWCRSLISFNTTLLHSIFINLNSSFSFATMKGLCSVCMRFLKMTHAFSLPCAYLQLELVDLSTYATIFRILCISVIKI